MSRTALIAVLLVASLPGAAVAKGPHATLSSPGEAPRPGGPWTATLQLFEFGPGEPPPPVVVARRADERVSFLVQELSRYTPPHPEVLSERRYQLRGEFPSSGRWVIAVSRADPSADTFRFELQVGGVGATPPRNLLALPGAAAARGTPLAPEVVELPSAGARNEDEPVPAWIFAAAAALAAAVAVALLQARRRMSPG
jgi:hypothetical protein